MVFRKEECYIKKVWCGKGPVPSGRYSKKGTPYQCLQQGFGAGSYTEKLKTLPKNSLQTIQYIGEVNERRLKKKGITTTGELVKTLRSLNEEEKDSFLKRALKKDGGGYDGRAYNSILLYIHSKGVKRLPPCVEYV